MNPLQDAIGQPLQWAQPKVFARAYVLRGKDGLFAAIRWQGGFSTTALAEVGDMRLTFKREGVLQPKIVVRDAEAGEVLLTFKPILKISGLLTFENGKRFKWSNTTAWSSDWAWLNEDGKPVVQIKKGRDVEMSELAADAVEELPFLITLAWYLIIMLQDADPTMKKARPTASNR
ncbi:MAG TPA: hypothetical protein VKR06_09870 [Ktedonosporobacter sp.]|nr:hypothetical protein [Ktedonosporobacter sp.]